MYVVHLRADLNSKDLLVTLTHDWLKLQNRSAEPRSAILSYMGIFLAKHTSFITEICPLLFRQVFILFADV